MSAKVKASEVQAESAKDIKDEAVKVAEAEAAKKAEADAKTKAEKEAQAEADAKAKIKDGKTYIAQWTLHHDNKRYIEGDTLTLSDDDAEDLVDAGVLVAAK